MAQYTTTQAILNELQTTTSFSANTIPSISAVTDWIEEESNYIEEIANHTYLAATDTIYLDVPEFAQDFTDLTFYLKDNPIITVHSLQYATSRLGEPGYSTMVDKLEGTDFTVYNNEGKIVLLQNFTPQAGLKRIKVVYSYGYNTTPLKIRMLCTKLVTQRILNTLLNQHINQANDGGSISVGSISIVEPASYGVNTYKALSMDIDRLKDELMQGFGVHRYNGN